MWETMDRWAGKVTESVMAAESSENGESGGKQQNGGGGGGKSLAAEVGQFNWTTELSWLK